MPRRVLRRVCLLRAMPGAILKGDHVFTWSKSGPHRRDAPLLPNAMRLQSAIAAALLIGAPQALRSQIAYEGTTPGATTTLVTTPNWGNAWTQTFMASHTTLNSVSLWFYGGQVPAGQESFFSKFYLSDGFLFDGNNNMAQIDVDPLHQGRLDVVFATPRTLIVGNLYSFSIWTNNGGPKELCGIGCAPEGQPYREPQLERTTTDAFDNGFSYYYYGERVDDGRDLRFELAYAVPEPTAPWLIGASLAVFALRRRLRRRTAAIKWPR